MKKVLILGGALHQIPVIKTAKNMGLYVATADYLPDNPGHQFADEYHNISITEMDTILALAKELHVDGIICYGSDVAAPTAAYVCEKMGLPTNPLAAVQILTNKYAYRKFLHEYGFHAPEARLYTNYNLYFQEAKQWEYPVVIKPTDSSGCKGVNVLNAPMEKDLKSYFEEAIAYSRANQVIVEKFIRKLGAQISGDIFIVDGKIVFWSFGNEYYSSHSHIKAHVPIGEYWPLERDKESEKTLVSELQRLISAIHLRMGECNIEAMVDDKQQIHIMEFGPRSGGSLIPQVIEYATGVNLLPYIVKTAIGESCEDLEQKEPEGYWANYNIPAFQNGVAREIQIDSGFREKHLQCMISSIKPGEKVKRFQNGSDAVGLAIMKFDNKEQMNNCLSNIEKYIWVEIE